ncbi:MAG: serine/threonine protein kinase, partial [Lachnospiraceae bacterium]|nr:serine/threonine protein kinase [Lachnospiraceae bacterium]
NRGHRYRDKVQRFLMEARSIARFGKAKDIVNVYDYFEENNTAYIIMEYVDDPLLQDYLEQNGRLDAETACRITESIVEAVKKLHAKGIIHRDVSPDNIFIAPDYSIKLFDFGSAHIEDSQTIEEKVIKPGYTAPEQYGDIEGNPGFYTDIYSIGAILYHMVTGISPQDGLERYRNDTLQSPLESGIGIDPSLDRLIMEAMAVQTELRIQNMNQFSDALHGRRRTEYPQEKMKRQRRTRGWMAAVSILLVIAIGVGGTMVYNAVHGTKNILFDTRVTEDTLTVWVDTPGMQGTLREVVSEMQDVSESDSKVIRRIKEENQNIQFEIINIAKDGKTMEQALQEAKGSDAFPDVFVTDRVPHLNSYALVSYQDNVAASVEEETHIYLSQYKEKYQSQTEMPTSFDVLLLYAIGTTDTESVWYLEGSSKAGILVSDPAEMQKGRVLTSSLLGQQEQNGTIDLQKILQANEQGREYTYLGSEAVIDSQETVKGKTTCLESTWLGWQTTAQLAVLASGKGFDLQSGKFQFDGEYVQKMVQLASMSESSKKACPWKLTDAEESADTLFGNSILAGSGYRSVLEEAKIGNSNIPYEVYVPTVDGRMLAMHTGKLAVSAGSSKNKQVAGMRLVYFALEQQHSNSNHDTTYPMSITKTEQGDSFTSFFEVNPSQGAVQNLIQQWSFPCVLIGRGSGNIYRFAAGLFDGNIQAAEDEAVLQSYCEEYEKVQE